MENQKKQRQDLEQQSINASRFNRNLIERNRRMQMKNLLSKLFSIVPLQYYKLSVPDSIDQAITYIRKLKEKIEILRERNDLILKSGDKFQPVLINIKSSESTLAVSIISGLKKNFFVHQVISILVEEGAEVINISYHNTGDRVFHTIHSKPICTRIGIDTSRVNERLKELVVS